MRLHNIKPLRWKAQKSSSTNTPRPHPHAPPASVNRDGNGTRPHSSSDLAENHDKKNNLRTTKRKMKSSEERDRRGCSA